MHEISGLTDVINLIINFINKYTCMYTFIMNNILLLSQMVQSDWLLRGPLFHLETSAVVLF